MGDGVKRTPNNSIKRDVVKRDVARQSR